MRAVLDEVIGPRVIWPLWPQPDARTVIQPKPRTLWLSLWNLQPLARLDARDTFLVDAPPGVTQQRHNTPISIAAILSSQFDDAGRQSRFVISRLWLCTLCGAMLPQYAARKSLGHAKRLDNVSYASPATHWAQNFPEATSFRTSFSSVRSDTARRSRAFSASSSFSRFT